MSANHKQAADATVDDHLRNMIGIMKRGAHVTLSGIPDDPTFLSSHFAGNYAKAMAEKIEAALSSALALSASPAQLVAVKPGKVLPPQSLLNEVFGYDPDTGSLFRKPLRPDHFWNVDDPRGPVWMANNYNSHNAGKEALTYSDVRGYRHGMVLGVNYQAHRIIWKMVHGEDPVAIDHINGNPSDNRLVNLRACTTAENSRNYKKPAGSSQYRGVCWVKRDQAWAARISDGKGGKRSLGNHANEIDAAKAYDRAARELHGEFATLNFPEDA